MHAGTEQLLAIRDANLVDAAVEQHVANCADCRDRLAQLDTMSNALRELPQLEPPAAAWFRLSASLDEPAKHRYGWLGGAVAAAALLSIAVWQWNAVGEKPGQAERIAMTEPVADEPEIDRLVSQSRQLEQLLRELNSSTPRVMNAGTAGTIAGLQDGIAYIDYGLSYEQLDQSQSEQLWRQRVGLMNTLVQVRGAQLQQTSN